MKLECIEKEEDVNRNLILNFPLVLTERDLWKVSKWIGKYVEGNKVCVYKI